jgi:hypothetical protein
MSRKAEKNHGTSLSVHIQKEISEQEAEVAITSFLAFSCQSQEINCIWMSLFLLPAQGN